MSVRVRVRNFQSLEDAEIVIDGFVVVSGPNNSGKSALMRAIRALFTNASPGPLLRHGEAFLSVEISFEDGTTVLWEKGSERPGGKGKSINRYTLNGKVLSSVGRGVPPEVSSLGVSEISAGSSKIWPQIAEQFNPLFLLNNSGAVVAESLSDVEKVGRLTEALRLSEKDRRASSTELTLRRKDLAEAKEELEKFEGLAEAGVLLSNAEALATSVQSISEELTEVQGLQTKWRKTLDVVQDLEGFNWDTPNPGRAEKIQKVLSRVRGFQSSWKNASTLCEKYEGFSWASPSALRASTNASRLKESRSLYRQLKSLQGALKALERAPLEVPPAPDLHKLGQVLSLAAGYRDRLQTLEERFDRFDIKASEIQDSLAAAEDEVSRLLGDRGFCPTCKKVHEGAEDHS